ncbi:ENTH-domain-containing protein [Favolaschia claudopus]|uniref:ENTH-domain-containing protein n=1 Tax=Favolaschia claudopus TaxID=2862362 RepID=A0AAW0BAE0_9AGAR
MDRLEALGTSLSQITMYDIKSMYNQAKNVVLNVSEIEAKVREATNDDPWGASSTLMQDIANRTFNYPDFNEIMPSIYSRFMEKEARQWRQIYKALQLLEYLIKNGSERVVDDARSHISTIKMLRNFHYIDDKGKDEGINVRNRSRELVELLSDVDKIRGERRKAKANKHKYVGTGNDGGMSFASDSGGRYGGFGSESLSYGGGGGGGGSGSGSVSDYYNSGGGSSSYSGGRGSSSGFRDERRSGGGFDEYNAGDDEIDMGSGGRTTSPVNTRPPPVRKSTAPPPPPPPAPPVNLFDTDDDDFGASIPAPAPPTNKSLPTPAHAPAPAATLGGLLDDDDFDDFQAAPTSPAAPAPAPSVFGGMAPVTAAPAKPSLHNLLQTASSPAPAASSPFSQQPPRTGMGMMGAPMQPAMQPGHRVGGSISSPPLQPQTPNYTGLGMTSMAPAQAGMGMGMAKTGSPAPAAPSKPAASFDDLWSMSLGSSAPAKPATSGAGTGTKSIKDLEKEKAMAGLWGSGGQQQQKPANMGMGMGMGMGGMGGAQTSSSSSGFDDLLG